MPADEAKKSNDLPLPQLLQGVVTLRRISAGSYGTVYLGRDAARRELAIKAVSPKISIEAQERERQGLVCFLSEFQNGGEHLLGIHQISPAGEPLRYSMELADNLNDPNSSDDYQAASLAAWIGRHGPQPVKVAVDCMHQLIEGVAALHTRGLMHRDIKPENIYFVRGRLKIGDLGLVTRYGDAERTLIGTREYIPEDMKSASPEMDLYALGKILYTITTGLAAGEYPRIPKNMVDDAALKELNQFLLSRACAREPSRRFHTASAFREAFDAVCNPAERARRRQRILRRAFIAAQLTFVAILITILAMRPWRHGPAGPDIPAPDEYIPINQAWDERIPPTNESFRLAFSELLDDETPRLQNEATAIFPNNPVNTKEFELYFEVTTDQPRTTLTAEFHQPGNEKPFKTVKCVVTPRGVFDARTVIDAPGRESQTWGIRIVPHEGELLLLANGRAFLSTPMNNFTTPWTLQLKLSSEEKGDLRISRFCCFTSGTQLGKKP